MEHWLAHKAGADFIVVDGGILPRQGALAATAQQGLAKFADAQAWIRQRSGLPLRWAEYHPSPPSLTGPAAVPQLQQAVEVAERAGASVLLFWNPVCRSDVPYGADMCLWSDNAEQGVRDSGWFRQLRERTGQRPAPAK